MAYIVCAGLRLRLCKRLTAQHAIAQHTSAVRLQRGHNEILHDFSFDSLQTFLWLFERKQLEI